MKRLIIFLLFSIFCLLFSSWLMFHTFSYDTEKNAIMTASKLWSDFGAHIPMIRSFSKGGNFERVTHFKLPDYPIYPGEPIRYHFTFYMIVGLLEKIGLRIDWALNIPSIIGFSGLLILIFYLATRLFRNHTTIHPYNHFLIGILSVLFFLFNGSLSFLKFFGKYPFSFSTPTDIIRNTQFPSFGPWDNGLVSAFWNLNIYTNQRHLAMGFSIALLFIGLLLFLTKKPLKAQLPFLLISSPTLILLPYFHQPTLLIIGIFMAWYFLVFPKIRVFIILTGIISAIGVIPQLLLLSQGGSSTFSFYPGYLIHDRLTTPLFFTYWYHNLGLHMFLIPLGFLLAPIRVKKIIFPILLLFIVGNVFKFSVEIAANHKFFNFMMIFGNILSAYVLILLYQKIKKHSHHWIIGLLDNLLIGLFILFLTISGVIDFFVVKNDYRLGLSDIPSNQIATWIAENAPKDAIFLNSSFLYHPASVAGRSIFLGWPYFAWSAGYKENRMPIQKEMYESMDRVRVCSLFSKYNISYITVENVSGNPDLPTIRLSDYLNQFQPSFLNTTQSYAIFSTSSLCQSIH